MQARYAVRNNQRNFVKITLPAGATVWNALLSGNPVRPGQANDGSLLLPLEKARGGEDAPAFVVEVLYLNRATSWDEKGKVKLSLPALDLPISRTGLLLYYPPLFRVTADPGPFRLEPYALPASADSTRKSQSRPQWGSPTVSSTGARSLQRRKRTSWRRKRWWTTFRRKSESGKVSGILPIGVSFPAFGPSLYLAAELTGENQAAFADFTYQRDKKGIRDEKDLARDNHDIRLGRNGTAEERDTAPGHKQCLVAT